MPRKKIKLKPIIIYKYFFHLYGSILKAKVDHFHNVKQEWHERTGIMQQIIHYLSQEEIDPWKLRIKATKIYFQLLLRKQHLIIKYHFVFCNYIVENVKVAGALYPNNIQLLLLCITFIEMIKLYFLYQL